MKQIVTFTLVILLCLPSLSACNAQAETSTIKQFITQVKVASGPVDRNTLEAIALLLYEQLAHIPLLGVQESMPVIDQIIALQHTLMEHPGIVERLFAYRIQQALDRTIMFEVSRRNVEHLFGYKVSPPYNIHSIDPEIVMMVLEQNAIAEREAIQEIRSLEGKFALFSRSKNFSIDDFLLYGWAVRAFPSTLKTAMQDMQIMLELIYEKTDSKTMEDFLFVTVLTAIDQARDIRIGCQILLFAPPESYDAFLQQITQILKKHPTGRVSTGGVTTMPNKVFSTISRYSKPKAPDRYLRMLMSLFRPYVRDTETVRSRIDDVYFKYTSTHGAFEGFGFLPGVWLDMNE